MVGRQRPAPGQVMLHQQQLEQAASFLLACQWPKIVQPRTGWRHARQQPDFLLLFGTCGDSLSGTTTGDGAAEWIKTIVLSSPFSSTSNRRRALKLGTTDLRGLRNTLVQKKLEIYLRQKSRFWSVHACLNAQLWTENQCNQATLMAFYTNFAAEFFHTVFTRRSVLKGTLGRDQKVIFVKSRISIPKVHIVMPLYSLEQWNWPSDVNVCM